MKGTSWEGGMWDQVVGVPIHLALQGPLWDGPPGLLNDSHFREKGLIGTWNSLSPLLCEGLRQAVSLARSPCEGIFLAIKQLSNLRWMSLKTVSLLLGSKAEGKPVQMIQEEDPKEGLQCLAPTFSGATQTGPLSFGWLFCLPMWWQWLYPSTQKLCLKGTFSPAELIPSLEVLGDRNFNKSPGCDSWPLLIPSFISQ